MRSNESRVKPQSAMVPQPVAYRECKSCGFVGLAESFATKDNCSACERSLVSNTRIYREPTSESQRKEATRAVEKLIRDSKRSRKMDEAPSLGRMINTMIDQFGSLEGFSKSWYSAITTAKIEDPGGAKVLRAHEQLARLMVDANRLKAEYDNVSSMSDDEIKDELLRIIQQEVDVRELLSE